MCAGPLRTATASASCLGRSCDVNHTVTVAIVLSAPNTVNTIGRLNMTSCTKITSVALVTRFTGALAHQRVRCYRAAMVAAVCVCAFVALRPTSIADGTSVTVPTTVVLRTIRTCAPGPLVPACACACVLCGVRHRISCMAVAVLHRGTPHAGGRGFFASASCPADTNTCPA